MNGSLQAHRVETTLTLDGTLTLEHLPFRAGEEVEVIVLPQAAALPRSRYPLRGTPVDYQGPKTSVLPRDCSTRKPSAGRIRVIMNIWRIMAHHQHPAKMAEWSRHNGVIATGWGGAGDLRDKHFGSERELSRQIATTHPNSSVSNYVNGGGSLWRLYHEMKQGDLVIMSASGPAGVHNARDRGLLLRQQRPVKFLRTPA